MAEKGKLHKQILIFQKFHTLHLKQRCANLFLVYSNLTWIDQSKTKNTSSNCEITSGR